MSLIEFLKKYRVQIFFAAGIMSPFLAILMYPKFFHPDDLDSFLQWSRLWSSGWRSIYISCPSCNYPFLGMFFSSGLINLLGLHNFDQMIGTFRYYLALVDLLNVVVIYFFLKKIRISSPMFWAGVVGLLPSSWVGTSYWGQIDNIGQSIILATFLWTASFNLTSTAGGIRPSLFAVVTGLLFAALVLTKQLVMFSMISLGLMIVVNFTLTSKKWMSLFFLLFLFVFSLFLPIIIIDQLIKIPSPYFSHLQYILMTGSSHGDVITSYGFNIWSLFVADPFASSHNPLTFALGKFIQFDITPFETGIALFLLTNLFLFIFIVIYFRKRHITAHYSFNVDDIVFWLLHLGLVNLSFNLFLTGTHERYLYYFYPYAIIAFLGVSFVKKRGIYILLAGAFFYGAFLFGYLTGWNLIFGSLVFDGMCIFHSMLFVYMYIAFIRHVK